MLVTFKTDAYPNITLFENNALAMLKMMGLSVTVADSIRAEDASHALALLTAAPEEDKAPPTCRHQRNRRTFREHRSPGDAAD